MPSFLTRRGSNHSSAADNCVGGNSVSSLTRATGTGLSGWGRRTPVDSLPWPPLRIATLSAALLGYVLLAATLRDALLLDSGVAYDASSYWRAAYNAAHDLPVYWPVAIGDPEAYRYVPTFAHLLAPVSGVPHLVLTWLYRAAAFLCLRYLMGSWTAVGLALLFPPVTIELLALNITLPIAAGTRWAIRGASGGALLMPVAAVLKFGSFLLLPYLWIRRPSSRLPLILGFVGVTAVLLTHAALDPTTWRMYWESLVQQARSPNEGAMVNQQLLVLLPSVTADFAARLAIGAGLTAVAVRRRSDALVYVAVVIAVPTLWLARLAPLVAVPRLWMEDRQEALATSDSLPGRDRRQHDRQQIRTRACGPRK